MINLLPPEEKKKIRSVYRLRVTAVVLAFTAVLAAISFAALLPSYFIASSKYAAAGLSQSTVAQEEGDKGRELGNEVRDVNQAVALLLKGVDDPAVHSLFEQILSQKPQGVSITGLSYGVYGNAGGSAAGQTGETLQKKITISGRASEREDLLSFMRILNAQKMFSSVDLPISNFVKDHDLDFSINTVLASGG